MYQKTYKGPTWSFGTVVGESAEGCSFFSTPSQRRGSKTCREDGLAPCRHGNTCRLPANTTSFADHQRVVEFLLTYVEANAIFLPGRIPGYKPTNVQLLPCSMTKRYVWQQYCKSLLSLSSSYHQVAYSTICSIWCQVVPQLLGHKANE